MSLTIHTLGRLEILWQDRPIPNFKLRKNQALLIFLAMNPGQHDRTRLAGLLWGGLSEARARRNLRHAVWHLRQSLHPDLVECDRLSVGLNSRIPCMVDARAFDAALLEAQTLRARGDEAAAIACQTRAIEYYRGDFLAQFEIAHCREFEEWAMRQRARLRDRALTTLSDLTLFWMRRGAFERALEYARKQTALEPLWEEAHVRLMTLLAHSGQRDAALAQYESCRRILAQELNVVPLPETTALYQRLLEGDWSEQLSSSFQEQTSRLPFRGREEEHAALVGWWECAREDASRLTLIEGEAGVGKTRLVEEVTRYIEAQGAIALHGRCYEFGDAVPYQPIAAALRSAISSSRIKIQNLSDIWLAELARLVPELRESRPDLPEPRQAAGLAARQRLFEAVARFLRMFTLTKPSSHPSPALFFLDDLQWADPATLDLLHYLVRQTARAGLWLVGAYRPEELDAGHPLTRLRQGLGRDHLVNRLILEPLSEAAVKAIAGAVHPHESEALGAHLYRETAGNPLFIGEWLQNLREMGALDATSSPNWADKMYTDLLPPAMQDVILQRVGRLSRDARRLLRLAAIYGRDFDRPLLQALSRDDRERIDAHLNEWLTRRLVQPQNRVQGTYRFGHDKIQAAVVHAVRPDLRRELHLRVAETLERIQPHRHFPPALLAHHWLAAERPQAALPHLLRAGDEARLLYAHEQAINYYRQALDIMQELGQHEQAARTLMKLGLTHHNAFDFSHSREAYDRAFTLWQRVAARPAAAQPASRPLRLRWQEPETLDPALVTDEHTINLLVHLFSGLVQLTPGMNITPDVAHSWEVCEAGRRFLFHLRKDAYWSDGEPVTAHDFEYAWKRLLDPVRAARAAPILFDLKGARAYHQGRGSADEIGVQALDDHTLAVELERPSGYFLQLLIHAAWLPVPRHALQAHGPAWADPAHFVGNGAFSLHTWRKGEALILRRNPHYHGRFRGNVQEVILMSINDVGRRRRMYETGELDVVGLSFFSATDFEEARLQHAEEYVSLPWLETHFLAFDAARPPFDDVRVRGAFVRATDREALANEILQGRTAPALGGLTPPGMWGHVADIALPFDPDAARRLLAKAGHAHGRGLPPVTLFAFEPVAERNRFLQRAWSDILGVEVRLEITSWVEYAARLGKTGHHIVNLIWVADYPDPDNFLRLSRMRAWPAWRDEEYEELVRAAGCSLNQSERLQLYARAEQRLVDQAPILPLLYERDHLLIKPHVKRYPMSAIRTAFWKDVIMA
ncbi:MAG: AAA family ATPase [Chloroflexi bacterium]|nr:AAA family ATPase [Chloroflexota bacterium]